MCLLTRGLAFIALLLVIALAGQPVYSPRAAADVAAADSIINLVQWEEAAGGNGHWYGVVAIEQTWIEAESLAVTLEWEGQFGYLATIRDSAENAFIVANVLAGVDPPTVGDQLYLGGEKIDGAWVWISGEQLCWTNWAYGEPNYRIETVISMWGPGAAPRYVPGTWNNTLADDSLNIYARYWSIVEWGELDTTSTPFVCGNGVVECQETCDDGNTTAGDGCNETCRIENVPCGLIVPGDENADGRVNAQDVILLLAWVFKGGPTPWDCPAIGDVNCSGAVTSADIIYLVYYIFTGGPEPCDPCYSSLAVYCEF